MIAVYSKINSTTIVKDLHFNALVGFPFSDDSLSLDGGTGPVRPNNQSEEITEEEILVSHSVKEITEISDLLIPQLKGLAEKAYEYSTNLYRGKGVNNFSQDILHYLFIGRRQINNIAHNKQELLSITKQELIVSDCAPALFYAHYNSPQPGIVSYKLNENYLTIANSDKTVYNEEQVSNYAVKEYIQSTNVNVQYFSFRLYPHSINKFVSRGDYYALLQTVVQPMPALLQITQAEPKKYTPHVELPDLTIDYSSTTESARTIDNSLHIYGLIQTVHLDTPFPLFYAQDIKFPLESAAEYSLPPTKTQTSQEIGLKSEERATQFLVDQLALKPEYKHQIHVPKVPKVKGVFDYNIVAQPVLESLFVAPEMSKAIPDLKSHVQPREVEVPKFYAPRFTQDTRPTLEFALKDNQSYVRVDVKKETVALPQNTATYFAFNPVVIQLNVQHTVYQPEVPKIKDYFRYADTAEPTTMLETLVNSPKQPQADVTQDLRSYGQNFILDATNPLEYTLKNNQPYVLDKLRQESAIQSQHNTNYVGFNPAIVPREINKSEKIGSEINHSISHLTSNGTRDVINNFVTLSIANNLSGLFEVQNIFEPETIAITQDYILNRNSEIVNHNNQSINMNNPVKDYNFNAMLYQGFSAFQSEPEVKAKQEYYPSAKGVSEALSQDAIEAYHLQQKKEKTECGTRAKQDKGIDAMLYQGFSAFQSEPEVKAKQEYYPSAKGVSEALSQDAIEAYHLQQKKEKTECGTRAKQDKGIDAMLYQGFSAFQSEPEVKAKQDKVTSNNNAKEISPIKGVYGALHNNAVASGNKEQTEVKKAA